jgi:hypothetical protein
MLGCWRIELRVPTAARWDRERNCAAVCCAETDGTSHELVRGRKRVHGVSLAPLSRYGGIGFQVVDRQMVIGFFSPILNIMATINNILTSRYERINNVHTLYYFISAPSPFHSQSIWLLPHPSPPVSAGPTLPSSIAALPCPTFTAKAPCTLQTAIPLLLPLLSTVHFPPLSPTFNFNIRIISPLLILLYIL